MEPSSSRRECDMSKKGFDDRGQGLGRREAGNKPLASIDKTLAG